MRARRAGAVIGAQEPNDSRKRLARGATGRYIHRFVVEDGRTLAAMSGCVKLFPQSRIACEEARLRKKQAERQKRGWGLGFRDREALAAIDEFYAGTMDERTALNRVDSAKRANQAAFGRYR